MSLRLIYGRAGTGKSQFCYDEISKIIEQEEKIYIITPEQFSFTAEKKLLESLNKKAVINAEVLTFERMAYRILSEVGGKTRVQLSKTGKAMLIYNLLSNNKNELKFLGKSDENVQIIEQTITELKKHRVTVENVKNIESSTENKYLKYKLEDIRKIYEEYQNTLSNNYIDEDDILDMLTEKIEYTNMFKNSVIYIDEFVGFTKQEYELIRKLLKVCKQINITICSDSLTQEKNIESDIFFSNKETINTLISIANKEKIIVEEAVFLEEKKRFKKDELKHLEENIYAIKSEKYEQKNENIELFLAQNPFSEIEHVAKEIIKLVRDNNYKYNDISVITKNLDTYSNIAKVIFNKYNIPIFIDEKKDLNQNILVKYVLALLEIFAKNWSYEAMFNYIKTGLCDIDIEDMFMLENYCIKWGIKGNKWTKEPWKIADSDEELEKLNELREKIVNPLLKFKNSLNRGKNCEELSKAIYTYLIENKIDTKLTEKIKILEENEQIDLANEYKKSWDILINVLDEMVLVLKEQKISFDEYSKLLKIGLQNSGLGKIPATQDQVIMGDVDRSRTHKVKAVFIVALNDGIFPSVHTDEGYLNDEDRNYLKNEGIELAKNTVESLYEDNFNIYKAFTVAEEKLYLSYSSTDNASKALRPSMLLAKLKKIFELEEKSDIVELEPEITTKQAMFDELLINIKKYEENEIINPIWFEIYNIYMHDKEWKEKLENAIKSSRKETTELKLTPETIKQLYGNTLRTSISRLEQYKKCAFSYYLKYGLKLSSQSLFQIQSLDTGTFMHDVIDEFFSQIEQREIKLKEISEEQIDEIVENIINEKLTLNRNYIFTSTKKFNILTIRLKNIIKRAMKYIIETITESDFEVLGTEVEFKKNEKYPPIEVKLDDGSKVELTGKIDRIDFAENKEGKFVRIIDYKSSIKNIDLNEVVAGLQIQLLTYLDAVTKKDNFIPAGVLYFNLIDPIIKADKNKTDEEIELEIKKQFKMKGLILADVNVIRMHDNKLKNGFSKLVPAYINSEGDITQTRSKVATKEEFYKLQKYMNKIIKEISQEIMSGNISIKPYYNVRTKKTPCEYCEYKAICNFDSSAEQYNYIQKRTREEILESL